MIVSPKSEFNRLYRISGTPNAPKFTNICIALLVLSLIHILVISEEIEKQTFLWQHMDRLRLHSRFRLLLPLLLRAVERSCLLYTSSSRSMFLNAPMRFSISSKSTW